MRKLFKKSLACILTAIICVSLCVAAVPASAAAPTYSTNEVVAKAGEAVDINFTVSNFANVKGAMVKFFLPEVVASITEVKINGEALDEYNPETGAGYYEVDKEEMSIKFLSLFGYEGELDSADALTFAVKAVIAEDAAVGTYNYAAPIFQISEDGETLADVTGSFEKFEIVPSHTHAYGVAYLNTEDGNWYKDCDCGDKIAADANVITMNHSSSILISEKFGLTIGVPVSAVAAYDSFELVVTSQHYRSIPNASAKSDFYKLTTDVDKYVYVADGEEVPEGYNKQDSVTSVYLFTYRNLTAYEMTLNLDAVVYLYKGGKIVAVTEPWTHNLAERALREYGKATTDISRSLYVDAMNYGAAVQKKFATDYAGSDLAANTTYPDAAFKDYQQYATKDAVAAAALCENVKAMPLTDAGKHVQGGVNLIISAANEIMYNWNASKLNTNYDASQLKLVIDYVDSYGNDKGETINFSDLDSSKNYVYYFANVALYDGHKTITASLYEGETLLATRTYSVESYAKANDGSTDANLKALCNQLAKLRYSSYEVLKAGFKN